MDSSDDEEHVYKYPFSPLEGIQRIGNIKGTSNDKIRKTWWEYMRKEYDFAVTAKCCIGGCHKPSTSSAHMAFEGRDNVKKWRLVCTCSPHNKSGHGAHFSEFDWQPTPKGRGGIFHSSTSQSRYSRFPRR